ncbi:MAG TPA: hypothetical protein VFS40_15435 [Gemmatimonadales bacterium]|nr:hypothetical protein [Gemmatimonadales bacterium]
MWRRFQHYLEPLTASLAIVLTLVVVALIEVAPDAHELAVLAPIVWLLQSFYVWRVRRARQRERRLLLGEVREMLRDQINNQLMVILANTELTGAPREELETMLTAARRISTTLERLSEDSLASWRASGASLPVDG